MGAHESFDRHDQVERGSERSFGVVVGGALLAISGYLLITGASLNLWITAPGVALVVLGLVAPRSLRLLNIAWMQLGLLLGRLVTPVVMLLVYVVSVVPTGLLLRLFGKDLLRLKPDRAASTYWIERIPPGPAPESLKDQF